jgi:hypothetical protein
MHVKWRQQQLDICEKYGAGVVDVLSGEKVGIARNVRTGLMPINGVRTLPEKGTCGWYIWAGEKMSEAADFFVPLHVDHLDQWCEAAIQFLLLPPGWRFLTAGDYVDVWFDPKVDLMPT